MGGLILSGILLFAALVALFIPFPKELLRIKKIIAGGIFGASALVLSSSAFSYNDAGFQTHVRTIFSTESAVMDTGWYLQAGASVQPGPSLSQLQTLPIQML
jgi:hypothetical protein